MLVNLIGSNNGVGLTRDTEILTGILTELGHKAITCDWQQASFKADLNIFLEILEPRHFDSAPKHIGIFNLEWFDESWARHLNRFDQLWAKSQEAYRWFQERHLDQAIYTGFTSRDLFDKQIPKLTRVIHVRGQSQYKNTKVVLEAWRRNWTKLPPLSIITRTPMEILTGVDQWINVANTRFSELMNGHAFHLCPSRAEGWGHYIAEAIGCKGLVITTNASPMNEIIRPEYGWLVDPRESVRVNNAHMHAMDPDDLTAAVIKAVNMSSDELGRRQYLAREKFLAQKSTFVQLAKNLISNL